MSFRAGFAEVEITPLLGTHKIGWIQDIVPDQVVDPLFARAAVFTDDRRTIALLQLDTLSIRWTQVNDIRRRIERQFGIPGDGIMVTATHNHAGPPIANCGRVARNAEYIEQLIQRCVAVFGQALAGSQPAEWGFGHTFNFQVALNRRIVLRDGTVCTHGSFSNPDACYLEGPIDPTVSVLAVRAPQGQLRGCLVNYSCHPTHHGGDQCFSAGYPGVLARELRKAGCPCTLYLNGASGNVHTSDPTTGDDLGMEQAGTALAADVQAVLAAMHFSGDAELRAQSRTLQLPYRMVTDDEVRGTVRGAQRFVDPQCYDDSMPALLARISERRTQPAEVQVLSLNDYHIAGIPAEYFVEHGLRIKTESYPHHALVAAQTNGMVGYVPTQAAFTRGGYETTFMTGSKLAPEAGDLLADAAIALIRQTDSVML